MLADRHRARRADAALRDRRRVRIVDGPPMLKSENARLSGWVYVDVRGRDLVSVVRDAQAVVRARCALPSGYSISWSGQFEYLERAKARLAYVVPFTLLVIFVLLYLTFRRIDEALLIMLAVPFALIGGFWLLWLLGYATSVATCRRLHRAGRRGGRVRRRDAALPAPRVGGASRARRAGDAWRPCARQSSKARCCACAPRR